MKNVHVIPTDKPSRLHLGNSGLVLCDLYYSSNTINSQHIYITNSEEIKGVDWYIYLGQINKRTRKNPKAEYSFPNYKKIILTTDQDLIKDGVQPIDDTFLEWFVKNPSCESVEIDLVAVNEYGSEITVNGYGFDKFIYKIIIQKEEPKQETLEEAAKRLFSYEYGEETYVTDKKRDAFIEGAEWQQERMYSEKEVESLLHKFMQHRHPDWHGWSTTKWFEQYKKK